MNRLDPSPTPLKNPTVFITPKQDYFVIGQMQLQQLKFCLADPDPPVQQLYQIANDYQYQSLKDEKQKPDVNCDQHKIKIGDENWECFV